MTKHDCRNGVTTNWPWDFLCMDKIKETGKGVKVAIIDSGYQPLLGNLSHIDKNKTVDFTSLKSAKSLIELEKIAKMSDKFIFLSDRTKWDKATEDHGRESHGSRVASIIGGRAKGNALRGIAPDCDLHIVKIYADSSTAGCNCAQVESLLPTAILWAVANNIAIVNISLDLPVCSPELQLAIREAYIHHTVLVCAAGNDDESTAPAMTIGFPAALQKTLAIGAYNSGIEPVKETDKGVLLDFVCPGQDIPSFTNPGEPNPLQLTSAATAYATGLIALLYEKRKVQGKMPYHDLKSELIKCRMEPNKPYKHIHWGYGIIHPKEF